MAKVLPQVVAASISFCAHVEDLVSGFVMDDALLWHLSLFWEGESVVEGLSGVWQK